MSATDEVNGTLPAIMTSGELSRYLPEPSGSGGLFSKLLAGAASLGSVFAGGSLDGTYAALLNQQIQAQMQMQLLSFESNIEKSKHETQMAAIRNMRVG